MVSDYKKEYKELERKIVLKQDILEALSYVGICKGQTVMVHTSLSSLGFVCGGAQVMIEALLEAVGDEGTIMMPAQSWKNLDPAAGVHWEEPEEWWPLIRENWPAYNKAITPTNTMGAVAEMFRKWPGTLRSDHPARSVAANGRYALYLTSDHDLSNIFGEGSPIGKLYELDGTVLLIGVGYIKTPPCTLQMSEQIIRVSIIVRNSAQSWKTAGGCGNGMKHFMWTAKILTRLVRLLKVSAMLKRQILGTVRLH